MIATKEQILLTLNLLKMQRLNRSIFDGAASLKEDLDAFNIYNFMIKKYNG